MKWSEARAEVFKDEATFKEYMKESNRELIQQLRDRLPEKEEYNHDISWEEGFNDCLKQVHQLLDEMGEE